MNKASGSATRQERQDDLSFQSPTTRDGADLHALIAACPPLDINSRYCNLLQVTHFSQTSVLVRNRDGDLVGAITGYLKPEDPQCLFIWQVAVHEKARGMGLARRMLHAIADRQDGRIERLETTIERDNKASWRVFEGFAEDRRAPTSSSLLFSKSEHFDGEHGDEMLLRIGPFGSRTGPTDRT